MIIATLIKDISLGLPTLSEVQSIISMAGNSDTHGRQLLEKEMRVLHLDPQAVEGDCVPRPSVTFS